MLAFATLLTDASLDGVNTYASAYQARIQFYADRIDSLSHISSWSQRLFLRHVGNYEIPAWIAANRRSSDTILLPPAEYADRYLSTKSYWTDPRIFIYFAGFVPVVAYDDVHRRAKANAFIALEPQAISIVRPGGSTNIDSLLDVYEGARKGAGQ
jgi:hypothetical protein